jgi:hypothetical protein
MVAIAWPGLTVDAPVQAANQGDTVETWIDQVLKGMFKRGQEPEQTLRPAPGPSFPGVLRLTLDEAMALFLKQNLDLMSPLWNRRREGPAGRRGFIESHPVGQYI